MQIADNFPKDALPPRGGALDINSQLRMQQLRHRRILRQHAVSHWWPFALLIVLGSVAAGIAGQFAYDFPIYVFGPILGLVVFYLVAWRVELGLLITAICSSPFLPKAFSAKSLDIYPAILLLIWLFCVLLVMTAFHVKKPVLPSFWAIWPLLGLLSLAFISNFMVQFTWTAGVPHKIYSTPIIYSEIYGIALFFLPLIVIAVTTAALTEKDDWIEFILNAFLILAILLALFVIIQFKRIGASVYSFRFSDPKLGYMPLKAIAQLLGLGSIIAYARFLYATRLRTRILYGVCMVTCLLAVFFCLENSWWLEVGVALVVITLAYSRRLFLICCTLVLPLAPLLKGEIAKLAVVKSADYYRLIIWQDSLRVWSKQPILGVGPGNFWAYDQRFTQLGLYLRQFEKTGLGVSHNGFLQMLGEVGPLGLFFYLAFIVVTTVVSARLFQRSKIKSKPSSGLLKLLDLNFSSEVEKEKRNDRILGLIGLGLICGSAVGDFTSGAFFLQPRQIGSASGLPQIMTSWIVWGCVIYKDKLWRIAQRGFRSRRPLNILFSKEKAEE